MKLTNNLSALSKFYLGFALIWTTIVAVLCLINNDKLPMPKLEKNYDKLGHLSFHLGITTLWFLYFNYKYGKRKKALIYAFLFSLVFGILLEICQAMFTTSRDADILDVLANTIGGILAVLIILFYKNKELNKN